MKSFLALAVLLLASLFSPAMATPNRTVVAETEKTMVALRSGILGGRFCSGVAVGPHMVQTQAHCVRVWKERSFSLVLENQEQAILCFDFEVVDVDDRDNALIYTPCHTWEHIAKRASNIVPYMSVFQFGWPASLPLMYREGVFSGRARVPHPQLPRVESLLFSLNGYYGDSGGGIFNEKGELICTTSFVYPPGAPFYMVGCFPQRFRKENL